MNGLFSRAGAVFVMMLVLLPMRSSQAADPEPFAFTAEGIKTLDPSIQSVKLTEQGDKPGTYLVDMNLNKDPFTGGAQDWNSVAGEVGRISKQLLARPEAVRIHFAFWSPANNNIDWARVFVEREKLPKAWQDLTYLQFFSFARALGGTLQSGQWMCDFYDKYKSAKPKSVWCPRD